MKFSIDQSVFKDALHRVLSVVDKKTPNPVLSNILMDVAPQELVLTATNMDIAVIEKISLTHVEATGVIVAPAHMLSDIVARMPSRCEIMIEIDRGEHQELLSTFTISTDKVNYKLGYLEKKLFPDIRPASYSHRFSIRKDVFYSLLNKTRFSMASEEVRHFLSGIYLFPYMPNPANEVCAVATDGHRMAKVVGSVIGDVPPFNGIIIPGRTSDVLVRLLASQDDASEVICSISEASLYVEMGSIMLISKLVDGQYPDYNLAIPKGESHTILIPKESLVRAADRIALVADPILRAITADLDSGRLHFTVPGSKTGHGFEEILVESDIERIRTSFNADYLIEATRHISTESVEMKVIDSESAIMLQGKEDPKALYVLMPIVS